MFDSYLKRIYTWESLENTDRGVEFELKNRLIDVELNDVTHVKIDGEKVDEEDIRLVLDDGAEIGCSEVTEDDSLAFDLGDTAQFVLDIDHLDMGEHTVGVGMDVDNFGEVGFSKNDAIPGEDDREFEGLRGDEGGSEPSLDSMDAVAETVAGISRIVSSQIPDSQGELEVKINKGLDGFLATAFDSKKQFTVYMGVKESDGTTEEVCHATGMTPESVEDVLSQLEESGLVTERRDGVYEACSPVEAARILGRKMSDSVEEHFLM